MAIGIKQVFRLAANMAVTSNATLADVTGMSVAVTLGQKVHIRGQLLVTVGATGGIRFQVLPSAAATTFSLGINLSNTVAPSTALAFQAATAAFTNALANAGNHFIDFEGDIVPSATGTIKLQFAQNTSDVLTGTLLLGSWMETTVL